MNKSLLYFAFVLFISGCGSPSFEGTFSDNGSPKDFTKFKFNSNRKCYFMNKSTWDHSESILEGSYMLNNGVVFGSFFAPKENAKIEFSFEILDRGSILKPKMMKFYKNGKLESEENNEKNRFLKKIEGQYCTECKSKLEK